MKIKVSLKKKLEIVGRFVYNNYNSSSQFFSILQSRYPFKGRNGLNIRPFSPREKNNFIKDVINVGS
jgi:hypothetical protein